jgi:hypothetical protein
MNIQRYISSELHHFIGQGKSSEIQFNTLTKVLKTGWLTHKPHLPGYYPAIYVYGGFKLSTNKKYQPQVVCFCDIPIADIGIHTTKYSHFGLSFRKAFLESIGARPVFYIPTNSLARKPIPGNRKVDIGELYSGNINKAYTKMKTNRLFDKFERICTKLDSNIPNVNPTNNDLMLLDFISFLTKHLWSYVVVYDSSLSETHVDNYYYEREWRVIGNVKFDLKDVSRVFLPASYATRFKKAVPNYSGQITFC